MKPFDLEAAKAGAPIQVLCDDKWTDAHFVGIGKHGHVVAQGDFRCGEFSTWTPSHLRMAPVKRTVYVNLYDQANPFSSKKGRFAVWHDSEEAARAASHEDTIAVAVPVEIEQ